MAETYYKVLNKDGSCCHGGKGSWHLPVDKRPGEWMPRINNVVACKRGYHVCRLEHLASWFGPAIFIVETDGDLVDGGDKLVAPRARLVRRTAWSDKTARLFAADCAERVLPLFEKEQPNDSRPRDAIGAARQFANSEIGAAASAAESAAASAAESAAAWAAVSTAASAAASAAAWAAVSGAAWAAAWAAASAAAWAAASAAESAAESAAAWAAQGQWQTARMAQYINGEI